MKQHLTPKQLLEVTEEQFYSLFDEIVKRNDWSKYHHKKMTIGKMIEYLMINTDKVDISANLSFFIDSDKTPTSKIYKLSVDSFCILGGV